jgi:hypothetical protein
METYNILNSFLRQNDKITSTGVMATQKGTGITPFDGTGM